MTKHANDRGWSRRRICLRAAGSLTLWADSGARWGSLLRAQDVADKLEASRQQRLVLSRFEKRMATRDYTLAASFTGHTMIVPERSVLVRGHLVIEVLLIPNRRVEERIDNASFGLKINGESRARLPQSAAVAAYVVRNPELQDGGPRLEASAEAGGGRVIVGSEGRGSHPRFPGDPRVPPRRPAEDREAPRGRSEAELDADVVLANAFPEGILFDPTVGYLYFPISIKLSKIRRVELLFRPAKANGREAILRLK